MKRYELVVVGAGPAGTAAAIAAARSGCNVLLIEKHGYCGGMATAGMVNPFLGNYYRNPETGKDGSLIGGLCGEILARLTGRDAVLRFRYSNDEDSPFSDAFDDAWLRMLYDEILAQAGVQVLYHSQLVEARCAGGHVESVRVVTKGGIREIAAQSFIDSTGDADLADACGAGCDVGRDEDGLCQPCSTMFRIGGVDTREFLRHGLRAGRKQVNDLLREDREEGNIEFPYKDTVGIYPFPRPGVLHFNATRMCGAPALTGERVSELETEGRRQVRALCEWLIGNVPCFGSAFLDSIAPQVGVRETRRVRGRCRLSREEILDGARFEDGIARSAYFIDVHDPKGAGSVHAKPEDPRVLRDGFKPKRYYEIPFRSLQPEGMDNLLVACRAISTDHYAHAATRVMATMTAVGEAAGTAAGLGKERNVPVGAINGRDVRERIAYLDLPLFF